MIRAIMQKKSQVLTLVFILLLSVFLINTTAFAASKVIKVGTSDVIHIAKGVMLEISSNSLNDYARVIKEEKEIWEPQMKAEEEEWKQIRNDDERKAAELAWEKKWKEFEADWKWRYEHCKISAKMRKTSKKVKFVFGPHGTYFVTPAVKLCITWSALASNIEDYLRLFGEGEEIDANIKWWGIEWCIPHFSRYYYRRR